MSLALIALWSCAEAMLLRLPRFLLVIALVAGIDRLLATRWPARARLRLLAACWVLFYAVYFTVM